MGTNKGGEGQHLGTHRWRQRVGGLRWGGGGGHGKGRVVSHAMLCSLALAARLTTSDCVGQMCDRAGARGACVSAPICSDLPPLPLPPRGALAQRISSRLCSSRPNVRGMLPRVTASED